MLTFDVERPEHQARVHLLIRLLLLIAVGMVGCSSLYWALYLALPGVAALLVNQRGAACYLEEDGQTLVRMLRWVGRAYAYLWLLTDDTPSTEPEGAVKLELVPTGAPTIGSALARVLYSLPALVLLMLLSIPGYVLWAIGALWLLIAGRVPEPVSSYLEMVLRYQLRLFAYHLSLTDRYPSLSAGPHAPPLSQAPAA
jgi:hypothetical protein